MKNLISILCLIFSSYCYASEPPQNTDKPSMTIKDIDNILIHTNFTGDEDYLYLNLDLNPQLAFPKKYNSTMYRNGLGCDLKINCPKESALFFNNEKIIGYELKVIVANNTSKDAVFCNFIHTVKTVDEKSEIIYTVSESNKIKNPSLDLDIRPEFFFSPEHHCYGKIVFKNSFPYSQL